MNIAQTIPSYYIAPALTMAAYLPSERKNQEALKKQEDEQIGRMKIKASEYEKENKGRFAMDEYIKAQQILERRAARELQMANDMKNVQSEALKGIGGSVGALLMGGTTPPPYYIGEDPNLPNIGSRLLQMMRGVKGL